jgi:hypothetical protein
MGGDATQAGGASRLPAANAATAATSDASAAAGTSAASEVPMSNQDFGQQLYPPVAGRGSCREDHGNAVGAAR